MSSIVCCQILVPNTGLDIFPFSLYAAVNKAATKKGIFGGKKSKRGKIENSLSLFPLFLIRHTLILQTKQEFYKKTSKRSKQNEENKNFATTLLCSEIHDVCYYVHAQCTVLYVQLIV
jgi:hypothetical protein